MAARWEVVIRGARKPLVVELTSRMALAWGVEPSELMPTLWAYVPTVINSALSNNRKFFIAIDFLMLH
jgi:hypothetical protein